MRLLDTKCARRCLFLALLVNAGPLLGQDAQSSASLADHEGADHSVRFYYIPAPGAAAVDGRHMAVLKQRIAVALENVPLSKALEVIAAKAGMRITYGTRGSAAGPLDAGVTLHAENITVEAALTDVLADAGLDVQLSQGVMALVPQGGGGGVGAARVGEGRVIGRVVDSITTQGVGHAGVRIDELNIGVVTDADGRFELDKVQPGRYQLTVRRVGFLVRTVPISVVEDSTTRIRVALNAAPTRLNEVVSTALGEQRRGTIGNDISTINVDSLAATTPVMDITDVLSARAPSVEVMESNGEVGNGASLRIRGTESLILQGDPIIVIDGVRIDNAAGGVTAPMFGYGTVGGVVPSPSRINDIDFNDVESIDILKGPSAATEYGTDAANGVIVIKTKHAHAAGPPQWHIGAEQAWAQVGTPFPSIYYSWGHEPGSTAQVECPLLDNPTVAGRSSLDGTCQVDSIVKWNALNGGPTTSMFGWGTREKVDASVSGGSDAVRYYAGGSLTNEVGTLQLPTVFQGIADSVGLPHSLYRPNSDNQRSGRANTFMKLSSNADMQLSAAYMTTYQTAPQTPDLYEGIYNGFPINNQANYWGYTPNTTEWPVYEYAQPVSQQTDRFIGSGTINWSPWTWLSGHLTAGIDHQSQTATAENLPAAFELYAGQAAELAITDGTTDVYSIDFRTAATAQVSSALRSTTSVGVQMVDTRTQAISTQANGISTTNPTLNGATDVLPLQIGVRQATLGGYIEEQFGLWERLFLTGAVRIDDGSAFGEAYSSVVYPKASVSWLALNGRATTVRFRGAFGASGIQPPVGGSKELVSPLAAYVNNEYVSGGEIANAPNANLQPERSNEYEAGTDVSLLHGRVNVGFTGYQKWTNNAIVSTGTGWELGSFNSYENIGEVSNTGFETTISATLLDNRETHWDVSLNGSTNHNDLVKLAPGLNTQFLYGDHAVLRFAPGTPLYGYAAEKEHYSGPPGGPVTLNDVTVDDSLSYAGPSQPTLMASFSSHLSLLHGLLTIGTLFDYRGGFRLMNTTMFHAANAQVDEGSNFGNSPIWLQERDAALIKTYSTGVDGGDPPAGFYEDASYVRWRELSVTLALPDRWAHAARFKNLSLTGAIRNVFLWTPFTGGDPEVTASEGLNASVLPTTGLLSVNNNIRESGQPVPLSRYFVLRLNAGF